MCVCIKLYKNNVLTKIHIIIFEYIHIENLIFEKLIKELDKKNYYYSKFDENLVCFPEDKKDIFKLSNP